jgi:hypothetical protein
MEVKWEKRKEMQGTRVRKAAQAQEGRISFRGSYCRTTGEWQLPLQHGKGE